MRDQSYRDGNSAAGALLELFSVDMTSAIGTCAECRASAVLAEALVFDREQATVLHCRSCDATLLRIIEDGTSVRLDLRGLEVLVVDTGRDPRDPDLRRR